MDRIKGLLKSRIDIVSQILTITSKYFDMIKESLIGMNPRQYEHYTKSVAQATESTKAISEIDIGTSGIDGLLSLGVSLYDLLGNISDAMGVVRDVVENEKYLQMTLTNMSATFLAGVQHDRRQILLLLDKYHEHGHDNDLDIIGAILEKIGVKDNIAPIILFLTERHGSVNKFIIELLRESLNYVNGVNKQRLQTLVEKEKDILLGATRIHTNYPGPQSPLVRYGLCPRTASMPIWELLELIGAKWINRTDIIENLTRVSKEIKAGLIIIDKSARSPIEFDIRGLVSIEYITQNDLKTTPQSGLSKKVLERYNTVKELVRGKTLMKSAVTTIIPSGSTRVYIIETLNGNLYRIMSNTLDLHVNIDSIQGLIDGLSTRPMEYNRLHEAEIIDRCFDPKSHVILTAYSEDRRAAPSSTVIKEHIIYDFTQSFEDKLGNEIPQDPSAFREVIIGDTDEINEILLDRLIHTMGLHGKGSTEYTLTYLTKFDTIIRQFVKELDNQIKKHAIDPIIFKERSGDDLKRYLMDVHKDIITGVVNELDRSKQWTEYDTSIKEFFLERKYAIV